MAAITSPSRSAVDNGKIRHLRVVGPNERTPRRPTPATYRRRRLLALILVAGLLLGAKALVGGIGMGPLATPDPAASFNPLPAATTTYVVQPGDTIWSVARRILPSGDVRPLVQHLSAQVDGPLRVGQRLHLS